MLREIQYHCYMKPCYIDDFTPSHIITTTHTNSHKITPTEKKSPKYPPTDTTKQQFIKEQQLARVTNASNHSSTTSKETHGTPTRTDIFNRPTHGITLANRNSRSTTRRPLRLPLLPLDRQQMVDPRLLVPHQHDKLGTRRSLHSITSQPTQPKTIIGKG